MKTLLVLFLLSVGSVHCAPTYSADHDPYTLASPISVTDGSARLSWCP